MLQLRGPPPQEQNVMLYGVPSKEALSDRLAECYDTSRSRPLNLSSANYSGCVYVLECANESAERAKRRSLLWHEKERVPWWVGPARSAETRLYVGRAKECDRRLWEHIQGVTAGGAHFTDIFAPRRLQRVFLYGTYTHKDLLEGKVSQTIDRETDDGTFVYSDRYDTLRGHKDYGEDAGTDQPNKNGTK